MDSKSYQDHFFRKAREAGYRSRSAFKLIELDKISQNILYAYKANIFCRNRKKDVYLCYSIVVILTQTKYLWETTAKKM